VLFDFVLHVPVKSRAVARDAPARSTTPVEERMLLKECVTILASQEGSKVLWQV